MSIDAFVQAHSKVIVTALISVLAGIFGVQIVSSALPGNKESTTLSNMQTQLSSFQAQLTSYVPLLDSLNRMRAEMRQMQGEVRALVIDRCAVLEDTDRDVSALNCFNIFPDYRTNRGMRRRR